MKRIAAVALSTFLAAPAFAGGPMMVEPEPMIEPAPVVMAPATDWSGFYAGGQLGYGDVGADGADLDGDGWLGGIHAGYRWDLGGAVLGIEGDYDIASIDLGDDNSDLSGELDSVARLKLMAGADLGHSVLYATAGYAYANASVNGNDLADDGYFYGMGLSYAMNDTWTVGGEVLRHEFEDFDGSGVDFDATTVMARVSYNF